MDEKVVVGKKGSSRFRRWFTARNVLLVVGIIVLAGGAGVGARWLQMRGQKQAATKPTSTVGQRAQIAALQGHPSAAQQQIADALKQPNLSQDDKYGLYMQQGSISQGQGDNAAALASFKKAAEINQTQNVYECLANVSVLLGDNPAAIAYYKKAIQFIPATSPLAQDYKDADEQHIRDLGGQP